MSKINHMLTEDCKRLARELSHRGHKHPGERAMQLLGEEKAVKRKYHDEYLDLKMRGKA